MFVVTNTIRIKLGYAEQVLEGFKNPKGVQHSPGFVRLELWQTKGLEEHDEIKVCTTWENGEAFRQWTESDAFKQAHAGRGGNSREYMLGAKLDKYEIVASHVAPIE
ncbi:antibiotic biosynthesis monooxygenase [Bacillus sp. 165]|uniref:antibiotic biosynthesis monooxygenase n=1 Tax=Bacillus sp. 165 TaxID=1529117 RepID=UPI001ADA38F7|nr:antibiotic biosynthesis monooxygenase [Bacillus sp. 165]MBO9130435.1 antibiotic biosynthesis monooxygenase [Bacillus sp. 165]